MKFLCMPLRFEGDVLVPVSTGTALESEYLLEGWAIQDICESKGWKVSRRSKELARCVAGEFIPLAVLETGGGVLMALWRQVAA